MPLPEGPRPQDRPADLTVVRITTPKGAWPNGGLTVRSSRGSKGRVGGARLIGLGVVLGQVVVDGYACIFFVAPPRTKVRNSEGCKGPRSRRRGEGSNMALGGPDTPPLGDFMETEETPNPRSF